jgi:peroxiredoxin
MGLASAWWIGITCLVFAVAFKPAPAAGAVVGDPLPSIELTDVENGAKAGVSAIVEGSVSAIVYMQTSCAACRKELMALKGMQAKFPELKIIAISVDVGNPARVKRYKEHFEFDFPFLHDPEFETPELFGFAFTPALVLVDKQGKVALLKGGFRPGDEAAIEQDVMKLTGKQ